MNKKKWMWMAGAVVLFFLISSSVFAAVNVVNRTGAIKIVMPDGTEVIVGAGEELPKIPDKATIEILSGSAEIDVTQGFYIYVIVGESAAFLDSGDAILASFNPNTSEENLGFISGSVEVITVTPEGKESILLDANNPRFKITLVPEKAAEGIEKGISKMEARVEAEEDSGDISPSS
ncbi:MAG: hypothetical protein KAS87_04950 [Candidatus Omnitrophica bacterium]|nr:hypothetical protein [Candidatus Omnitrophota bacterium]